MLYFGKETHVLGEDPVSGALVFLLSLLYWFTPSVILKSHAQLKHTHTPTLYLQYHIAQVIVYICWLLDYFNQHLQVVYWFVSNIFLTLPSSWSKLELSLFKMYRFWKSSVLSSLMCSENFWSGLWEGEKKLH